MNQTAWRPLPILKTLRRAAALLWMHRALLLRLVMLPFLLLAAAASLAYGKLAGLQPNEVGRVLANVSHADWLVWVMACVAGAALLLMFSVSWRRFLLLNELPPTITVQKAYRYYLLLFVTAYLALSFASVVLIELLFTVVQWRA